MPCLPILFSPPPFMPLPHLSLPRSLNFCASTFCPSLCRGCYAHSWTLTIVWWLQLSMDTSIKLHLMPSPALSFPTSLCQCPTLGTSCFPQALTSPFTLPVLVHFHVSPGLDVCSSVSAFAALLLWVPSPKPGSQGQQTPTLWVERLREPRWCQPLLLLLDTCRGRAWYPRASLSVGGP